MEQRLSQQREVTSSTFYSFGCFLFFLLVVHISVLTSIQRALKNRETQVQQPEDKPAHGTRFAAPYSSYLYIKEKNNFSLLQLFNFQTITSHTYVCAAFLMHPVSCANQEHLIHYKLTARYSNTSPSGIVTTHFKPMYHYCTLGCITTSLRVNDWSVKCNDKCDLIPKLKNWNCCTEIFSYFLNLINQVGHTVKEWLVHLPSSRTVSDQSPVGMDAL